MSCQIVFTREVHSWGEGRFAGFVHPKPISVLMKFPRDFQVSAVYVDLELIELKCLTVFLRRERFQVDEEYCTCQNFVSHRIEYSATGLRLWVGYGCIVAKPKVTSD